MRRTVALSLGLMLVFAASAARADATIGRLGALPGGDASQAAKISADGSTVVGFGNAYSASGSYISQEAFRWTATEGMVGLGDLSGGSFSSSAAGVSGDGSVVVGTSEGAAGLEAFRWTAADGMVGLGDLPGGRFFSEAVAVSIDGSTVVGDSNSVNAPDLYKEAFRWTATGGMRGLGDFPGGEFSSIATGASADGSVVVGRGWAASGDRVFRWTAAEGMVDLGPGRASNVTPDGSVIVGVGPGNQAMRWTAGGGMVGLGTLLGGSGYSSASGVSADGLVVVGRSDAPSANQAFIWDAAHGMRSLRDVLASAGADVAGWTLIEAAGVSADGTTIAGSGIVVDANHPSGQNQAWIASFTPIPLPECSDGIDNDGDGLTDYPADPGCTSPSDLSEREATLPCDDGIDNDGDGLVDFKVDGSGDPGCAYPAFPTESPACQDGIDNNGDGKIDFDGGASANHGVALRPPDPGCLFAFRMSEGNAPSCGLGAELALVLGGIAAMRRRIGGRRLM